jgi:Putative Zn-dependent protease, contains TPR repeats
MKYFAICSLTLLSLFLCSIPLIGQVQIDSLQELVNQKKYAKAIALAQNFTAEDSTNYDLMYALGQAYEGMLRHRVAYKYYDLCYRMDMTRVEILNTMARSAINIGKMSEAEQFYLKSLAIDTLDFYVNYQLAGFYYQTGDYDKSLHFYQCLSDMDEQNPALLTALGNCYIKLNIPPRAISYYLRAFKYNPENVSLSSTLVNSMLIEGGKYREDAMAICDTALYYNPNNIQLLQTKGMVLYSNRRYLDADTLYTKLMEAGDSSFTTLMHCGMSRYYAGKYVSAVEPFEKLYLKDSTALDVCIYLAASIGNSYDQKRAHVLFDRVEEMLNSPSSYHVLLKSFRAEMYRLNRQEDLAFKLYYELWDENQWRLDFLGKLYQIYPRGPMVYRNEETRQKVLFVQVLYTKILLNHNRAEDKNFLYSMRERLETVYDEMIFNEMKTFPMLAPNGKKSSITLEELRSLIDELPNERTK